MKILKKNKNENALEGRPEHTDSISYDGTWHYQLSGSKTWHLRPTNELVRHIHKLQQHQEDNEQQEQKIDAVSVTCSEGDVLLVDTRLWWHRTTIPPQDPIVLNDSDGDAAAAYSAVPSVSYARDVYLPHQVGGKGTDFCEPSSSSDERMKIKSDPQKGLSSPETNSDQKSSASLMMTNLDGIYAAQDIPADTILFRENEMPDCELHRSKDNYNCQVVVLGDDKDGDESGGSDDEDEDGDGIMAVVSIRDIKCGEFFCVAESSDEEEEEEEEEEISDDD
mmetsp:Transcript_52197/g.77874  ORF Transcript_52197/g.77874 Transcript_52197/m.77874 type:complete len:279 (-) Transcript_52197:114-950(-)